MRTVLGLVLIGYALICIFATVFFQIKKSQVKFLSASLAIYALIRGCFMFIHDVAMTGYNGIWRLFLNFVPEFALAFSYALFFGTWGAWLSQNREGTTSSNSPSSFIGTFTGFFSELKFVSQSGIFFIASVVLTILFTFLAFIIGSTASYLNLAVYFSACLGVICSGVAIISCSMFTALYPKKFLHGLIISIIPFVRMILQFVMAVTSERFGSSIDSVSGSYCAIIVIFELFPVVCLLILSFFLYKKISSTSNFTEPMLTNTDEDDY